VDLETARRHAEAVFIVLRRAVGPQEFADLSAELPKDFAALLPQGPDIEVISTESFIQRVADRAATDADEGRRAIDAVLETLAMRIAGARSTTCGRGCRSSSPPSTRRSSGVKSHQRSTSMASKSRHGRNQQRERLRDISTNDQTAMADAVAIGVEEAGGLVRTRHERV
jgi:hypothetical protein